MLKILLCLLCLIAMVIHAPALATFATGGSIHSVPELLQGASTLAVRYFEPTRERRTLRSVGNIDTSFDTQIVLNCDGGDCAGTLRSLPRLLSSMRTGERCPRPYYARIDLVRAGVAVGSIYVDYTGRCIDSANRSYRLDGNLLQALTATPPRDW